MRWIKPNIKSSLYALLGHGSVPAPESVDAAVDQIRAAMLALLGTHGQAAYPHLARKVRYATEIETLWYARNDLMAARASVAGEAQALRELTPVTALFSGLVPMGLSSRPRQTQR